MSNVRYAVLITTDDAHGSYLQERNERAYREAAPLPPLDGMAWTTRHWDTEAEAIEAGREAMARNHQAMSATIQGFVLGEANHACNRIYNKKVSEKTIGCGRVSYEYPDPDGVDR